MVGPNRRVAPDETASLVVRAQRGDADAFTALARRFLRAAYAVALAVVGRPADAEDVAQDAFVVAIERMETCREPARFGGWLLQIVRNRALNFLDARRLRDVPSNEAREDRAAPATEEVGLRERLIAALTALSPIRREVVLLHDLEGWTHQEIGLALGISELMSRQHLFNARGVLRGRLAEENPAEVNHG
ncbi:MAG: RNA polymerase sigma factor [Deltaproteobacteria bacterium]|nr:RNA polymerase sigma factor [Deltaproteobacteria bacterium]